MVSVVQKDNRKKVVFLGTPVVASLVLDYLVNRASHSLKLILVVSQPPARSSRSRQDIPCPVHLKALELGIPVVTPLSVKEDDFLCDLSSLEPDLCITAAYGNYLPKKFLGIPKYGTVNIHPSLLPSYRGAAPVQRSLENGDKVTGVTLLYTVKEMDAGPIIAQEQFSVDEKVKSPELLNILFEKGTKLLIKNLSNIFNVDFIPKEQDHSKATHARKIEAEESLLDFSLPAHVLHNKVRAFTPWPGVKTTFLLAAIQPSLDDELLEVKIITTEVENNIGTTANKSLYLDKNSINIFCGDGQILKIIEIQPIGKKVLFAKDFLNGLRGRELKIIK